MKQTMELSEDDLRSIYAWVDEIPLSRPRRSIARDFSDGCLLAEVVAHYFPHMVELHNYSQANSLQQKTYNLTTLNNRVLRRLGYQMTEVETDDVSKAVPGAIERVLHTLQLKIARYREQQQLKRANRLSPQPQRSASNSHGSSNGSAGPSGYDAKSRRASDSGAAAAAAAQAGGPAGAAAVGGGANGGRGGGRGMMPAQHHHHLNVDEEILLEKEATIRELQETVDILELKVAKLEQLVRLKDTKIEKLQAQLTKENLIEQTRNNMPVRRR